jgi:uncharacterized protein (DUF3084 family)
MSGNEERNKDLERGLDWLHGVSDDGDPCAKAMLDEMEYAHSVREQWSAHVDDHRKTVAELEQKIAWRDQTIADRERAIDRLKAQLFRWEQRMAAMCHGLLAVCQELVEMDDEVRR